MRKKGRSKKVVVAMSGGVDSSVSAALLKRAGFDVIGVFMRFWKAPSHNKNKERWNSCCSLESENRARKVAKILNIPFYVFNFETEFKKRIVDDFLKEFRKGNTPNPCVICNKEIKFGLLLEKAGKIGADFIATGHYSRIKEIKDNKQKREYKLLKAKDENKDQSYFLWKLSQKQLSKIIFPVGNYTRVEVENLAKKFGLPFDNVKKSMEICFVKTTIDDFLEDYLKEKQGKIINNYGNNIGRHRGLWFYTLGQRKGIGLSGGPYYVLDKDFKKNLLIVTKSEKYLYKKELIAKNVNWISGKEPRLPLKVQAKIRYRAKASPVTIIKGQESKTYYLRFNKPQRAITPGQSVVLYRGQEMLGGSIIK